MMTKLGSVPTILLGVKVIKPVLRLNEDYNKIKRTNYMGNCVGRREALIRVRVLCPRCGRAFPKGTSYQKVKDFFIQFNLHLDNCLEQVEGPLHDEIEHLSFWEKIAHGDQYKWERRHVDIAKGHLIRQKSAQVLFPTLKKEVRSLSFGEK